METTKVTKIYFDLETTGFAGLGYFHPMHRIIQFGAITEDGDTFCSYVDPGVSIDPRSTKLHGITDQNVVHAPAFAQVWHEFITGLRNSRNPVGNKIVMVAHNCFGFDQLILERELKRFGMTTVGVEFHDTEPVFRLQYPSLRSYNLGKLVQRFVPSFQFKAHDALEDAKALRALCQATRIQTYSFAKSPKRLELKTIWPLQPYLRFIQKRLRIGNNIEELCNYFKNDQFAMYAWMAATAELALTQDTIAYCVLRAFHVDPKYFMHQTLPKLNILH